MVMNTFIKKDNTHPGDVERISLLHILWENEELREIAEQIYSFKERIILEKILEDPKLSSSAKALITLGFSLYNNFPADISSIFSCLDSKNTEIALSALSLRYKIL